MVRQVLLSCSCRWRFSGRVAGQDRGHVSCSVYSTTIRWRPMVCRYVRDRGYGRVLRMEDMVVFYVRRYARFWGVGVVDDVFCACAGRDIPRNCVLCMTVWSCSMMAILLWPLHDGIIVRSV